MPSKKNCIRGEVGSTSIATNNKIIKSLKTDEHVVELILSNLPVKFAGRIGARSKRFHDSWKFSKYLDFDMDFAKGMTPKTYINTVVWIMKCHEGSKVRRFRLYSDASLDIGLFFNWFHIINKKGAKEVDLDFSHMREKERFVFYGNLIDSETTVKVLNLTHCRVKFPSIKELTCWCTLTSITLKQVLLDDKLNDIVNANCFRLEKLILSQCRGIGILKIHGSDHKKFKMLTVSRCFAIHEIKIVVPTLTIFHYRGYAHYVDISVVSASKLQDVVLDLISQNKLPTIRNFKMDLNHVEILTVSSYFIKALERPAIIIPQVKEVQILMETTSNCNLLDIANFLKSCPLLERVFIDINGFFFNDDLKWLKHDSKEFMKFSASFEHLKSVKVIGFKYKHFDYHLVKLFLQKSPQLQNMVLTTARSRSEKVEMKDIEICLFHFRSWLISPNVNVQVFLHPKDGSGLHSTHSDQLSSY